MGISHLYSSPILAARPGSMHGYDVIDPTRINEELGGEQAFRRLVEALRTPVSASSSTSSPTTWPSTLAIVGG